MTVHGDDVTAEGAERGRYMQLNGRVPVRTEIQGKRVLFKKCFLAWPSCFEQFASNAPPL